MKTTAIFTHAAVHLLGLVAAPLAIAAPPTHWQVAGLDFGQVVFPDLAPAGRPPARFVAGRYRGPIADGGGVNYDCKLSNVRAADLTGDGKPEAVVETACVQAPKSKPRFGIYGSGSRQSAAVFAVHSGAAVPLLKGFCQGGTEFAEAHKAMRLVIAGVRLVCATADQGDTDGKVDLAVWAWQQPTGSGGSFERVLARELGPHCSELIGEFQDFDPVPWSRGRRADLDKCVEPAETPEPEVEDSGVQRTRPKPALGGSNAGGGTVDKAALDARQPEPKYRLSTTPVDCRHEASAEVGKVVSRKNSAVLRCFEESWPADSTAVVRLSVQATIGTEATILKATVVGAADLALARCIQSKFLAIRGLPLLPDVVQCSAHYVLSPSNSAANSGAESATGKTEPVAPTQPQPAPSQVRQSDAQIEAGKFAALAAKANTAKLKVVYLRKATEKDPANAEYRKLLLAAEQELANQQPSP